MSTSQAGESTTQQDPKSYGHFDDARREYVITDPNTPYPWINYLGCEDFFGLISNTAGGYSFYRDAKFRRLTRYRYNNVPVDTGGRYFYIREAGEEKAWNPGWKPCKTPLDRYECRHGMGYTRFLAARNQLAAELTCFVPIGETAEVHRFVLRNESSETKSVKLHSLLEWCLWNAEDDGSNFQRNFSTGEVEVHPSLIVHRTEYKERRNHYAFSSVNQPSQGFDTDRESFLGRNRGFDDPLQVADGASAQSHAHGWSPIASHFFELKLAPKESKEFVFTLGYVEVEDEEKFSEPLADGRLGVRLDAARALMHRYQTGEQVDAALAELASYWDMLLNRTQVESCDERFDRMVNIWNPYQCMVTFNLSRSASYFESGIGRGMGFRDSNQDLLGCMHMIPERAKQRILDIAATQFPDGSAYHQYQPLTKRGNNAIGSNFNDDPLWLILSVSQYIKETGDSEILQTPVPFDNDSTLSEPLLEHLHRSFTHTIERLGPHNLPLIGRADWNDCLNLNCFSFDPNESFQTTENQQGGQAESVFIAGQFVLYGRALVELCEYAGHTQAVEFYTRAIEAMQAAVIEHGWDGDWYLRAYDFHGNKIGSSENEEGKIFIESQGFCAMAGIGSQHEYPRKALDSVKEHLGCEYGIVLQQPAYTRYYPEYGEISTYPAGYKENAGIFCHNNPWVMIAEVINGDPDQGFDYYRRITPAYLDDLQELHKVEPYVYCQMIAGKDAATPGQGKNSWLTGTAAWNYAAAVHYFLGVQADFEGIELWPRIPSALLKAPLTITRLFRGQAYKIVVEKQSMPSKQGRFDVWVQGKQQAASLSVASESYLLPFTPGDKASKGDKSAESSTPIATIDVRVVIYR